jgi:LAO/AO transport system kinase
MKARADKVKTCVTIPGGPHADRIQALLQGNVRALSRMITEVENREPGWEECMRAIYPFSGSACVIGITGSPGAGKSTLTNIIARGLADEGLAVGIIAVDPSSPFTGGALLGDRSA